MKKKKMPLSTLLTKFCPESDEAFQIWATFVRTSTLGIFKKFPKVCPDSPEAYLDFRQIFVRKRIRDLTGLSQVLHKHLQRGLKLNNRLRVNSAFRNVFKSECGLSRSPTSLLTWMGDVVSELNRPPSLFRHSFRFNPQKEGQ
jgi:hypothetical protein